MSYENPQVPHEVNVARDSPVAEFLRLAAGLALVVVLVSAALFLAGGWLARFIPFATEVSWVGDRVVGIDLDATHERGVGESVPPDARGVAIERYLAELTGQLATHMDLPRAMQVKVHYAPLEVPNAFATLGGHVVITRALYRSMPSENALAMVLAHEIGHLKARDPISALGGVATVGVALALISGDADGIAPYLAQVVQRGYSRGAETQADDLAVAALRRHFGHAGGAAAVFEVLEAQRDGALARSAPPFLSTHPTDAARIARLRAAASDWDPRLQPLRLLREGPEAAVTVAAVARPAVRPTAP